MIINMAVADDNEAYLERLVGVLETYDDLSLSVYTDKSSLETALLSRQFDVLLFSPSIYEGHIPLRRNTLAVMLYDETQDLPDTFRDYLKIDRYQRISSVYQKILERYADFSRVESGLFGDRKVMTAAFYSPIGGAGKTTLALTAASILAANGLRTLYVNLQEAASDGCYLPQTAEKGMSDLLMSLGEEVNLTMKIRGLLQSRGERLFYLRHFSSPNDIYELTAEEIGELIRALTRSGLFDAVLIDMGVYMNEKALGIFEAVQKILLIEKPDSISREKMNIFLAQQHILEAYGNKMVRILNCDIGREPQTAAQIPLAGKIGYVQNPDSAHVIEILSANTSQIFTGVLGLQRAS